MTLAQLRAFLTAVTLGSFTAAAAELGLSQPTVSEIIRKLETDHGLPLFVRGGRRLVLTAAGQELLPWARRIVEGADGARQCLEALRGLTGGVASLGVLRNATYYFLSDLAETFHSRRPGVRTRLVGQNSVEVAAAVRSGQLEAGLAVLPLPVEGLEVSPLLRDEVLWVSADPRRTARPVTVEDIAAAPLILYDAHYGSNDPTRRQLADRAQVRGVRLEPLIEVETVESALGLVARGIGDTMVSKSVVRSSVFPPNLSTVSFAEPFYEWIALLTRQNAALSPATTELVRIATGMLLQRSASPERPDRAQSPTGRDPQPKDGSAGNDQTARLLDWT